MLTSLRCWDFVQNVLTTYMDMQTAFTNSIMEDAPNAIGTERFQNLSKVLKMNKEQIELYKVVDEILWNDWDPIGINDIASRDEYQSYIPEIFSMLIENKDVNTIAERLNEIATKRMGLFANIELSLKVAEKLKNKINHHNNT